MTRAHAGPEDPEKGMPHRHARAKIRLLVGGGSVRSQWLADMLLLLAEKHPGAVLAAVTDVLAEHEDELDGGSYEAMADFISRNPGLVRDLEKLNGEDTPASVGTPPRRLGWADADPVE